MPASEFNEWMIYESIEPFGDRRADIQAGIIASTIANGYRTKESDKIWTPPDFYEYLWNPKMKEELKPEQAAEEQMGIFLALQASQNAIVAAQEAARRG